MKIITICILMFLNSYVLYTQTFECDGAFYLSLSDNNSPSVFYKVDVDPADNEVVFTSLPAANAGMGINAIGYRPTDHYIYGIQPGSLNLCRVDADGIATVVAELNDLDHSLGHYAGDISSDGKFLYLLATGGAPYITREAARVNLEDYSVVTYPIPGGEAVQIVVSDFSIDPIDGSIYAFDDKKNRLVKFDPNLGGDFDETLYPVSDVADAIGATFFDSFGNLYGYGRQIGSDISETLFKMDTNTGILTVEATGPEALSRDGCSCPYTIKLQKAVYPNTALPCAEVNYVFKIANLSSLVQTGQDLLDVMPGVFTILEIVQNPFGGDIVNGIGGNILSIENMTIPRGIDSVVVKVGIGLVSEGMYKNQALLKGLPAELGGETLSDDPQTLVIGDSTLLEITPLQVKFQNEAPGLCEGDTLYLVVDSEEGLSYEWSTGSTDPITEVTEPGWYWVKLSSICETVIDSLYVTDEALDIDLGADREIELGDSILLGVDLTAGLDVEWSDPLENSLNCLHCRQPYARPYFDVMYVASALNAYGCVDTDSVFIQVKKDRKIFIPNVFSPDYDGHNDVFYIQGKGFGLIKNFKVFNRWGAVVFETSGVFINQINEGWNGTYKTKELESGVYVYYAEIEFLDGEVEQFQGDITLIR